MRKHSIDPGIHHQIRTLLPDLAAAANNASLGLAESGRLDEGLNLTREAVSHSRRLAATDPSLLPDLAIGLNNLSNGLAEVGQPEEALTRAEEATNLYRKLAIADPESFLPDLALSLNSLSVRLAEVGRPEEGLGPIQAAVAIRRALVLADGSAEALGKGHRAEIVDLLAEGADSLPNLAASLNSLSVRLMELGRWEEALAPIQEAVRYYRTLARASREAFLPDLSLSLNNLSGILAEVGQSKEAELVAREAAVLGPPYEWLPDARPAASGGSNSAATTSPTTS
jgi:tetratricopeptide (TPR) repeat protein